MKALSLLPGLALVVYLCRWSGFELQAVRESLFWERFLRFAPISIMTALVVSSLYQETGLVGNRVVALALAGMVVWRTRKMGLSIVAGFVVLWLLSQV
jgi:branched-subunit amino acid transport protein